MFNPTRTLKSRRFVFLAFTVLTLGAIVGAVVGRSERGTQATQTSDAIVTSHASTLRVVGVQRTTIGDMPVLKVSLQNLSSKNIKAYTVASGKGWMTRDYFFTDLSFPPNAIETEIIPLSVRSFEANSKEFAVTGVLFEDGTADGEGIPVFRLKERHDGLRDQSAKLLPCLQQIASARDRFESELSNCEIAAKRLSVKGRSGDYNDGLLHAQQEFLTRLGEIKNKLAGNDLAEALNQKEQTIRTFQKLVHQSSKN